MSLQQVVYMWYLFLLLALINAIWVSRIARSHRVNRVREIKIQSALVSENQVFCVTVRNADREEDAKSTTEDYHQAVTTYLDMIKRYGNNNVEFNLAPKASGRE